MLDTFVGAVDPVNHQLSRLLFGSQKERLHLAAREAEMDKDVEIRRLRRLLVEVAKCVLPIAVERRQPEVARRLRAIPDGVALSVLYGIVAAAKDDAWREGSRYITVTTRHMLYAVDKATEASDPPDDGADSRRDSAKATALVALLTIRMGDESVATRTALAAALALDGAIALGLTALD
jgi:hypothetical protein